jgi:hypothetical protein
MIWTLCPALERSVVLSAAAVSALMAVSVSPAGGQDRPDSMMVERVIPPGTIGSINFQVGSAHLGLDALNYVDAVHDPALRMALLSNGPFTELDVGVERRFHTQRTGAFSIGVKGGLVLPLAQAVTSVGERAVNGAPRERARRYLLLHIDKPIGKRHGA